MGTGTGNTSVIAHIIVRLIRISNIAFRHIAAALFAKKSGRVYCKKIREMSGKKYLNKMSSSGAKGFNSLLLWGAAIRCTTVLWRTHNVMVLVEYVLRFPDYSTKVIWKL